VTSQSEKSKSMNFSLISIILLVLVAIIWVGLRVALPDNPTLFAGQQPDNLGVSSGKLAACPSTPNCVSSQSKDPEHSIEPLKYQGSSPEAIERLKKIVTDLGQSKIIAEKNNYLRAEFTSRWMGFVDDVEFYIDENAKAIDLRSASRLGESDLGVNRDRLENIRNLFNS
jgi:uncharacterized protein (DUF1499 family)